jgi:hypothetical protein
VLQDFDILYEQKLIPGDGGFELWVRKSSESIAANAAKRRTETT